MSGGARPPHPPARCGAPCPLPPRRPNPTDQLHSSLALCPHLPPPHTRTTHECKCPARTPAAAAPAQLCPPRPACLFSTRARRCAIMAPAPPAAGTSAGSRTAALLPRPPDLPCARPIAQPRCPSSSRKRRWGRWPLRRRFAPPAGRRRRRRACGSWRGGGGKRPAGCHASPQHTHPSTRHPPPDRPAGCHAGGGSPASQAAGAVDRGGGSGAAPGAERGSAHPALPPAGRPLHVRGAKRGGVMWVRGCAGVVVVRGTLAPHPLPPHLHPTPPQVRWVDWLQERGLLLGNAAPHHL